MNLTYELLTKKKTKPTDESKLGFGRIFTDHMFSMDYSTEKGWYNAKICPYASFSIDPSCSILHYGQGVFEGLKAYYTKDQTVSLFRPRLNFERMNHSNRRMGIPEFDVDFVLNALIELIKVDIDWVPKQASTSLYIRPFIFATDEFLGVRPSSTYKFFIIMSPSGVYYAKGMNPVSIYIEDEYIRAVRGGTGEAKCPGNYAGSLIAQENAHNKGFDQVLWLDGVEKRYIEEVGSMNVFFKFDEHWVTPALSGSILNGVTRRSVIELANHFGMDIREEKISVDTLLSMAEAGRIKEAFGSGTAAVISPIGTLMYEDHKFVFNNNEIGVDTKLFYETLTGIQYGIKEDYLNWIVRVN